MIMPIAVGIASKMVTDKVPAMVNMATPLPKFGVQMGVALGGNMLLRKTLGAKNANVWAIISAVTAASELIQSYLTTAAIGSIGYTPEYTPDYSVGAYPEEVGAYPYENVVNY